MAGSLLRQHGTVGNPRHPTVVHNLINSLPSPPHSLLRLRQRSTGSVSLSLGNLSKHKRSSSNVSPWGLPHFSSQLCRHGVLAYTHSLPHLPGQSGRHPAWPSSSGAALSPCCFSPGRSGSSYQLSPLQALHAPVSVHRAQLISPQPQFNQGAPLTPPALTADCQAAQALPIPVSPNPAPPWAQDLPRREPF